MTQPLAGGLAGEFNQGLERGGVDSRMPLVRMLGEMLSVLVEERPEAKVERKWRIR